MCVDFLFTIQRASMRERLGWRGSGNTPNAIDPSSHFGRRRDMAPESQRRVERLSYWGKIRRVPVRPREPGARFALKRRKSIGRRKREILWRRGRGGRLGRTPKRVIRRGRFWIFGFGFEWTRCKSVQNETGSSRVKSIFRQIFLRAGRRRPACRARFRLVSAVRRQTGVWSFFKRRASFRPSAHPSAIQW